MLYTASVDELPSQIIIIVVLLLVNAFFAASEMAIISASPVKLDILIENGNKKATLGALLFLFVYAQFLFI